MAGRSKILLFAFAFLLSGPVLTAQEVFYNHYTGVEVDPRQGDEAVPTPVDFYTDAEPLQARLESDFTHLKADRRRMDYQPATLHVKLTDSISMRCPVRIRPRGKSRLDFCDVPPLRIDFRESFLQATSLRNLEKVKLVSKCRENQVYEDYVLKEFLVYKLFNALSPMSFRVRFARITFVDTGEEGTRWENYAFVIEETDAVGRRIGLEEEDEPENILERVDSTQALRLSLFQYLIGNTDWYLTKGHNLKYFVIEEGEGGPIYPIPYDFDLTGMVDAAYAVPRDRLKQSDIKQRRYIGFEPEPELLEKEIARFLSKEDQLKAILQDFPYLNSQLKREMVQYLNSFYRVIGNPKRVDKKMLRKRYPYIW